MKAKQSLLRRRIYSALGVITQGPDHGPAGMLCEPFNPGDETRVSRLAMRVVGSLLLRILQTLPDGEVEKLIEDIEKEVVLQGTKNIGSKRRELVNEAMLAPLPEPHRTSD